MRPRYPAPRATIDPDRSKTWLRRALPIVMAHKGIFLTSLVASFVGLVLQVQIPKIIGQDAIDQAILLHRVPLGDYVRLALVLGGLAGVCGYVSRLFLMRTA